MFFTGRDRMQRSCKYIAGFFVGVSLVICAGCASTPQRESTGEYLDDSVITTKVKTAILNEPGLKFFDIHVDTSRGVVDLTGTVGSKDALAKAAQVAGAVAGVKSVKNELQVK